MNTPRRLGRRDGEAGPGAERWLLTYSDMITLLLALFIVLYALSSLSYTKYAQFVKGLNVSFNNGSSHPSSARTLKSTTTGKSAVSKSEATLTAIENQLRASLKRSGYLTDVELHVGANGLNESLISGKTFYAKDSAALSAIGTEVVDITGAILRSHPNRITVEGYTDNEPITGGPYTSNWQLSAERAVVVVQRLQTVAHVDPSQLYLVGFGQYHPVVPNDSSSNEAQNRRVDIVVSERDARVTLP